MESGVEYVLRFGEIYRGPEDDETQLGTAVTSMRLPGSMNPY